MSSLCFGLSLREGANIIANVDSVSTKYYDYLFYVEVEILSRYIYLLLKTISINLFVI